MKNFHPLRKPSFEFDWNLWFLIFVGGMASLFLIGKEHLPGSHGQSGAFVHKVSQLEKSFSPMRVFEIASPKPYLFEFFGAHPVTKENSIEASNMIFQAVPESTNNNIFLNSMGLFPKVENYYPRNCEDSITKKFVWEHLLPENTGLRSRFISFLLGLQRKVVVGHSDGVDQIDSELWNSLAQVGESVTCGISTSIFSGREALCVGTSGKGILFCDPQTTKYLTKDTNGMPCNIVRTFAETPDGWLWIGTDEGLFRWKNGKFDRFGRQEGLPEYKVLCLASCQNSVGVGTTGGFVVFSAHGIKSFTSFDNFQPLGDVSSVINFKGSWWMCTRKGLAVLAQNGIKTNPIPDLEEIQARCLAVIDNNLAIGTSKGLYLFDGNAGYWILRYPGEPITSITSFENHIAVGTWGNGIWVLKNALPLRT